MNLSRRAAGIGGALVLTLALGACGGGDDTPATSPEGGTAGEAETSGGSEPVSEEHNDADTEFAQGMIVHHRGAIAMSDAAADRAQSPEVQALSERISAAQGPEIETMSSWLQAWDEDVPEGMSMEGMSTEGMSMEGMDSGEMQMPGMMSEEQMGELEGSSGTGFDRMFLEMMTAHHEGAVEMAQAEQADGENPEAVELAATIEADQTAEIEEMAQLLQSL